MTTSPLLILCILLSLNFADGFSLNTNTRRKTVALTMTNDRRSFLTRALVATTSSITASMLVPGVSSATVTSSSTEGAIFKPGEKLSPEDAKKRFLLARQDAKYLLDHFPEISKAGGDEVRRYLGTVGVTSGMYGITKVLKQLQEEADDIVEYTETMQEFNAYLYQAEGAAYQSLFVEHSSAKGTPESFLATAKQDVVSMVKYMDQMALQLNL